jgi:hypothetical protein
MSAMSTVDPYIPLDLAFPPGVGAIATVIIRSEDNRSLVDLGIDMSTGRLTRATLVMAPVVDDQILVATSNAALCHGIPCFATAKFNPDSFAPTGEIVTTLRATNDETMVAVLWGDQMPDAKLLCGEGFILLRDNVMIGFGADRPADQ